MWKKYDEKKEFLISFLFSMRYCSTISINSSEVGILLGSVISPFIKLVEGKISILLLL